MTSLTLKATDFERVTDKKNVEAITRPSLSYWKDAWIRLRRNKQALFSLWIVIGLLVFTILGPFFWTVDPSEQQLNRISEGPSFGKEVAVLAEQATWEDIVLSDQPEAPEGIDGTTLPAPASLEILDVPTLEGVRLKWAHVPGAAGYAIYRSVHAPTGGDASNLGVPVGEVFTGNQVTYQDSFELEPKHYWYSVVAKNGEASARGVTQEVTLKEGMALSEAQLINPEVQPGQMIRLDSRPFGTDYLGRDLLARLMSGARVSLFIGFFAPLLYMLMGIIIGGTSGFFGGRIDNALMRITDFVLALPFLLFMILFKVVFGAQPGEDGIMPMLVAMVALSWTGSARLTRGQILQLRESEFVHAAKLLGAKPTYLIIRHLLPNTLGVILVSLTFAIPSAIFTEAFLSFIGMGVTPPTASWGSMCSDGVKTFLTHPQEFAFPALFIAITVLAFNLLGDGLRDALDPKMRSVE